MCFCSIIPFYLMFLNRRHAKRREELGKSADLVDESMMGRGQMQNSKAVEVEGAGGAGEPARRRLDEDNAMKDMTDLKNEDFIYVY